MQAGANFAAISDQNIAATGFCLFVWFCFINVLVKMVQWILYYFNALHVMVCTTVETPV